MNFRKPSNKQAIAMAVLAVFALAVVVASIMYSAALTVAIKAVSFIVGGVIGVGLFMCVMELIDYFKGR